MCELWFYSKADGKLACVFDGPCLALCGIHSAVLHYPAELFSLHVRPAGYFNTWCAQFQDSL